MLKTFTQIDMGLSGILVFRVLKKIKLPMASSCQTLK